MEENDWILIKEEIHRQVKQLLDSREGSVKPNPTRTRVIISKVLLELGCPRNLSGYEYLIQAIELSVSDTKMLQKITKKLYPTIAAANDSTPSKVERAIRYAVSTIWSRGDIDILNKTFGNSTDPNRGKPTNSEFISMIVTKYNNGEYNYLDNL